MTSVSLSNLLKRHPCLSTSQIMSISFSGNNTRSGSHHKLVQPTAPTNRFKHFYFIRLPDLQNSLSPIDLSTSYEIIVNQIKNIFWEQFITNFDPLNSCDLLATPLLTKPTFSPFPMLHDPYSSVCDYCSYSFCHLAVDTLSNNLYIPYSVTRLCVIYVCLGCQFSYSAQ